MGSLLILVKPARDSSDAKDDPRLIQIQGIFFIFSTLQGRRTQIF